MMSGLYMTLALQIGLGIHLATQSDHERQLLRVLRPAIGS